MPLTPKNRKEEWLQGLVDHETTLTPKNRPEEWMKEIIDASGSGGGGGTGGGVLIVHDNEGTLDKTWQEIKDAGFAILNIENDIGISCNINDSDTYEVTFAMILPGGTGFDDPLGYEAYSANDYPVTAD